MVEGGARRKRRPSTAVKRKRTTTTRRRVGAGVAKRRTTTTRRRTTTVRTATKRRTTTALRSAKGKPRGAHKVGKYTRPFLLEMWAKAKREKRRPTSAEFKEAMQKGWKVAREKGAV